MEDDNNLWKDNSDAFKLSCHRRLYMKLRKNKERIDMKIKKNDYLSRSQMSYLLEIVRSEIEELGIKVHMRYVYPSLDDDENKPYEQWSFEDVSQAFRILQKDLEKDPTRFALVLSAKF